MWFFIRKNRIYSSLLSLLRNSLQITHSIALGLIQGKRARGLHPTCNFKIVPLICSDLTKIFHRFTRLQSISRGWNNFNASIMAKFQRYRPLNPILDPEISSTTHWSPLHHGSGQKIYRMTTNESECPYLNPLV